MTKFVRCPCCEMRATTTTCAKCGRDVCDQCRCVKPGGSGTPPACYCGASCAQFEREWAAKKAAKEKA